MNPDSTPESEWLAKTRVLIESDLDRRLMITREITGNSDGARLLEAMRYALLGPGKRLRPALTLASAEAIGAPWAKAMPAAAAIEMLHAYTLVHDDLPAIDDDDARRGRPTVHVEFDEATAILAGDALLTRAFSCLAELGSGCAAAVEILGQRAGGRELLLGQAMDVAAAQSERRLDFAELETMHRGKTGALFAAAAELGGIAAGGSTEDRSRLAELGMTLGLAFQHGDDRLDEEHARFRSEAQERISRLAERAIELVEPYGTEAAPLRELVRCIALR